MTTKYKINQLGGDLFSFFSGTASSTAAYFLNRLHENHEKSAYSVRTDTFKAMNLSGGFANVNGRDKSGRLPNQPDTVELNDKIVRWALKIQITHAKQGGIWVPYTNFLPDPLQPGISEQEKQWRILLHPLAYTEATTTKEMVIPFGAVLTVKLVSGVFMIQDTVGKRPRRRIPKKKKEKWDGSGHSGKATGIDKEVDWKKFEGEYKDKLPPRSTNSLMPGWFQAIPNSTNGGTTPGSYRGGIDHGSMKVACNEGEKGCVSGQKKIRKQITKATLVEMQKVYKIKTIVASAGNNATNIKKWAGELGMTYIKVWLSQLRTVREVTRLNNSWEAILAAMKKGGVYIHCRSGVDRTGAIVGRWLWSSAALPGFATVEWTHNGRKNHWKWTAGAAHLHTSGGYTQAQAYAYTIKVACGSPGMSGCQWKGKEDYNDMLRYWAFPDFLIRK